MLVKACCQDPANLDEQPSGQPDLVVRICRVCHCRHFELTADRGQLGVSGARL